MKEEGRRNIENVNFIIGSWGVIRKIPFLIDFHCEFKRASLKGPQIRTHSAFPFTYRYVHCFISLAVCKLHTLNSFEVTNARSLSRLVFRNLIYFREKRKRDRMIKIIITKRRLDLVFSGKSFVLDYISLNRISIIFLFFRI